jgi:hypothetical protein
MSDADEELIAERDRLLAQINELGRFLMERYPEQIGKYSSEGAVDCAIRLLSLKF